jgi:hypothetical protein
MITDVTPREGIIVGCIVVLAFLFPLLCALDVIEQGEDNFPAGRPVVVIACLAFEFVGLALIFYGLKNAGYKNFVTSKIDAFIQKGYLGALILLCFTAVPVALLFQSGGGVDSLVLGISSLITGAITLFVIGYLAWEWIKRRRGDKKQ